LATHRATEAMAIAEWNRGTVQMSAQAFPMGVSDKDDRVVRHWELISVVAAVLENP
jgi:hypothetical protein